MRLLVALLLAPLIGCTPQVVDTACTSFNYITYSAKDDSPETVTQVRQHNAAWTATCKK